MNAEKVQFSTADPVLAAVIRNDRVSFQQLLDTDTPISYSAMQFASRLTDTYFSKKLSEVADLDSIRLIDQAYGNQSSVCMAIPQQPPLGRKPSLNAEEEKQLEEVLKAIDYDKSRRNSALTGTTATSDSAYTSEADGIDNTDTDDELEEMMYIEELEEAARALALKRAAQKAAAADIRDVNLQTIWDVTEDPVADTSDDEMVPSKLTAQTQDYWVNQLGMIQKQGRGGEWGQPSPAIQIGGGLDLPGLEVTNHWGYDHDSPKIPGNAYTIPVARQEGLEAAIDANDLDRVKHLVELAGYEVTASDVAHAQSRKCSREMVDLLVEYAVG